MSTITLPEGVRASLAMYITCDEGTSAVINLRHMPIVASIDIAPDAAALLKASGVKPMTPFTNPRMMTNAEIRDYLADSSDDDDDDDDEVEF